MSFVACDFCAHLGFYRRGILGAYWNLVFIYSSSIWLKALLFFTLNVMMNILGCSLLMHNAFFIVLLAGLLGLSPKRHSRRNWLSHNELLEEYGNFYNSISIFFHGYFSLHLPFTWGFFIKIQSESYGELTEDSSIKIMYRISSYSFRGNYSFLNLTLFTVTFGDSTYGCGNYSREETIQGRKLFAEIR